ncbi:hypothetical protein GWI33_012781, partial [Rhynchophorus ferrugineus]
VPEREGLRRVVVDSREEEVDEKKVKTNITSLSETMSGPSETSGPRVLEARRLRINNPILYPVSAFPRFESMTASSSSSRAVRH